MQTTIKTKTGLILELPTEAEENEINKGIELDDDTFVPTDEQFLQFKKVGRPVKLDKKQPVSIRLSSDVLNYFKNTGKGWQTQIDEILKKHVKNHV